MLRLIKNLSYFWSVRRSRWSLRVYPFSIYIPMVVTIAFTRMMHWYDMHQGLPLLYRPDRRARGVRAER
jgi:hypothetical protein